MVDKCYMCGTASNQVVLFDAVVDDGIVKVCESCSIRENIPLIKAATNVKEDPNQTTYERLSKMAGLDPNEHKSKFGNKEEKKEEDKELESYVNKKNDLSFPNLNQFQAEQKDDLIRNFHWSILKARRAQGYTYKSLAEAISESEKVVRLAERGVLPEKYHALIRKLQLALGITLFKTPSKEKTLAFDKQTAKSTTLSDLQEKQKEMEESGEVPEELQDSEEVEGEKKTPYWKRFLNLFKSRKRKRSEGPLEIPEEEIERDLNLAKTEDISGSSQAKPVEAPKQESPEASRSKLTLESLKRRKKQVQQESFWDQSKVSETKASEEISSEENAGEKEKSSEKSQESKSEKDELSQDEIDKIIFGGK